MNTYDRRRLQGYLIGRSCVLIALLLLGAFFQSKQSGFALPFAWFFAATACSFGFTLMTALGLRASRGSHLLPAAQPFWDIGYATALVYLSGGAFSPFASIYPLAIIGAAILLSARAAFLAATISSLAYGILVDLQFYEVLVPLNPFPLPATDGGKLLIHLTFHIVAFFTVAFLSGYLAEELRRTGKRLQAAEAEVLDLEHLQDSILQSLGSGVVALDPEGRELFHNRAAEEQLGRAGITIQGGMDFSDLFALQTVHERNEKPFQGGNVILGYSVSPLNDRTGTRRGDILICQDLTGIKQLEEDLQRADRLAAVGRLAAGLAHEIRNPLSSLSGSVEVLRDSMDSSSENAALFDIVLRETQRLNGLVTNFLHYARPGGGERRTVSVHELIAETGFFFGQGEGAKRLSLRNEVPKDCEITADHAQLEQLFLNLFRNSLEASPHGVNVSVTGTRVDDCWQIEVADDGPGMPAEAQHRAFEPFFSQKEGGTGLGLATVHRIVENHSGSISLYSENGNGTLFRIRFPADPPPAGQQSTDESRPSNHE